MPYSFYSAYTLVAKGARQSESTTEFLPKTLTANKEFYMSWLLDEWNSFKAWVVSISPKVIAFIKPIAIQIKDDEIGIAEAAIAVGATTSGDGQAKMTAALAYFAQQSLTKEIPFVESQARALIEIALQNAKSAPAVVA